jgi:hypothetical protein
MQTPFPPPSNRLQSIRLGLAVLLTGSVVLFSGTVAFRLYSMIQANKQQRTDQLHQAILTRVTYLKTAKNYTACIAEAQKIPVESLFRSQAETLQDQCQSLSIETVIQQAQAMAAAGQLKDAIAEIQTVSSSAAATQVRQLVWEWSNRMLQVADSTYRDPSGKLQEAIHIASAIAPDNLLYAEAQAKIRTWQQEWLTNQAHWQAAQAALTAHQPATALLQIQQITHPYWQQQGVALTNVVYAQQVEGVQPAPAPAYPPEAADQNVIPWETKEALDVDGTITMTLLLPFSLGTLLTLSCLKGK